MSTITIQAPASAVTATPSNQARIDSSGQDIPLEDIEAAPGRKQGLSKPNNGPDTNPPAAAIPEKLRWNTPRINTYRIGLTYFTLFNLGLNDASFGAVLPYVGAYYDLSYLVVSLIFLAPFVGYSIAALLNDRIHNWSGQRGIAIIGPLHRIIAYIVMTQHPPYPVMIVFLINSGYGSGLGDAAWNAYVGDFASANQLMGLFHAFYGLGGTLAPLIATSLITQAKVPWWTFYYIPMGSCILEMGLGAWAFWDVTGPAFRSYIASMQPTGEAGTGRTRAAIREKVTWLCAAFLFVYVGAEVSLGGWLVTFMQQVRSQDPFHSGITATGFWAGLTVGRAILGFVTPLMGERKAVTLYLVLAIGLELIFWLVPSAPVSAIAAALLGFCIGPLFPAAIVAATKLLPKPLHVPAIGFAGAIGGGGAALIPFAVGALANAKGVQTLEPVVLALLAIDLGLWLLLPRFPKHEHGD